MFLPIEHRLSDSPLIERVWRSHSERPGTMLSVAASHVEMVVTRLRNKTFLTLRGPETKGTSADYPEGCEWVGIRFKLGAFIPAFLPEKLRNRHDVTLPDASSRGFWLNGSAWEYPSFENAEAFATRLVRNGLIARDPVVEAVTRGCFQMQSLRSVQRHFLRATGITYSTWRQIERARHATNLLQDGVPIVDAVYKAGYFDQPHMTRCLRQRIGQTPAEIIRGRHQLSFLYKTEPWPIATMRETE